MEQVQLTEGRLLNAFGNLNECGNATSLVKAYDRREIKSKKSRIKEFDSYFIGNQRYGIYLKIADNSTIGYAYITFVDFENETSISKRLLRFMPNGKLKMPSTTKSGQCVFKDKNSLVHFIKDGKTRTIKCAVKNFDGVADFECNIELSDENPDSLVLATKFDKKKEFIYNQKINCLRAKGEARIGGRRLFFYPQESFASYEWSRAILPRKNMWYTATMTSTINGKKVGFNLSSRIGSKTNVRESIICYDQLTSIINNINFELSLNNKGKEDLMGDWKIKASDDSVNLTFKPVLKGKQYLLSNEKNNQIYGYFDGVMKLNNKEIIVKDFVGFIEISSTKF